MNMHTRARASRGMSLERKLAAYAVAGGAVILAAEDTQADIVYSGPQSIAIDAAHPYNLDLNTDSVIDYQFQNVFVPASFTDKFSKKDERHLNLILQGTNQVASDTGGPAALVAGTDVSSQTFNSSSPATMAGVTDKSFYREVKNIPIPDQTFGNWTNQDKYLGLKFDIGGTTHYGWAELSVSGGNDINSDPTAILLGWAYETTANATILTGATSSPTQATPEPSTLIMLATGAAAIGAYRAVRRKAAVDLMPPGAG